MNVVSYQQHILMSREASLATSKESGQAGEPKLVAGLYDLVLQERLRLQLESEADKFHAERNPLGRFDAPRRLSEHFGQLLLRALTIGAAGESGASPKQLADICNRLLLVLSAELRPFGAAAISGSKSRY